MIPNLYKWGGLSLIVISVLVLGYQKIWQAGYAARVAEEIVAAEAQRAKADKQAQTNRSTAATAAAVQVVTEQKIVERIRYVDREIPKVVELAGDCRVLGPAFLGVFNGAVEAANGGPGSPPFPPREPAGRMPALPARTDE